MLLYILAGLALYLVAGVLTARANIRYMTRMGVKEERILDAITPSLFLWPVCVTLLGPVWLLGPYAEKERDRHALLTQTELEVQACLDTLDS